MLGGLNDTLRSNAVFVRGHDNFAVKALHRKGNGFITSCHDDFCKSLTKKCTTSNMLNHRQPLNFQKWFIWKTGGGNACFHKIKLLRKDSAINIDTLAGNCRSL